MSPAKRKLIGTIVGIERTRRIYFGRDWGVFREVGGLLSKINECLLEVLDEMA